MSLPTRSEWEIILQRAEGYTLQYLSNPEMWEGKYQYAGVDLFYDDETSEHMGRSIEHLVDSWDVSFNLVGSKLKIKITNDKTVKGKRDWNLEELLFNGTYSYESENDMVFWWRFDASWHKTKKRRGINKRIVKLFRKLQYDAVDYGMKKSFGEWKNGVL